MSRANGYHLQEYVAGPPRSGRRSLAGEPFTGATAGPKIPMPDKNPDADKALVRA
jgi:hypothetical protein